MNHTEFAKVIASGLLHGVYLMEGTEEQLKDAALAALRKAVLMEGMEDLDEAVLDNPTADAIIAGAETLPFMSPKRLIIVRDYPALSGRSEADEKLLSYLQSVPDSTVLVFFQRGKTDSRKKLPTAIKKYGTVVSFDRMKGEELHRWIMDAFRQHDCTCSGENAALLAFTAGNDTGVLQGEIAKIAAFCGDAVTSEAINTLATRSIECTVFEMVDATVAGQQGKALRLMQDMLIAGEERLGILAMLLRQYRLLQHVKIMEYEKKPRAYIVETVSGGKGRSFIGERLLNQARKLSAKQVKRAVDICLSTELSVKSGKMNQEGALEAALLEILAGDGM